MSSVPERERESPRLANNPDMTARTAGEMRLVYVIGGRRIGGMETHLLTLASQLSASVRCVVCCTDASDDYLARLARLGIAHENLACPSLVRPAGASACRRLAQLVRQFDAHVVHTYGFSADVLGALLRVFGVPARLVTSRRGEDENARHHAVRRLINRLSDRVVCVSPETAAFVRRTESPEASLIEVIPNGVAPHQAGRAAEADPNRPVRFGTLGTVKPIKGPDLLVDAFMRFPRDRRVELTIAGLIDRPWAEALRQRAAADPRIRFIGRTGAPREFLSDLDVFVLPSRSEGMSNALLEAMAAGLPCIATDVGSNRSVLAPDAGPAAGLVVDPRADALFEAMDAMAADTRTRADHGARGAALAASRYTIPAMVDRYEQLYRTVMGRRMRAPAIADTHVSEGMTVDG